MGTLECHLLKTKRTELMWRKLDEINNTYPAKLNSKVKFGEMTPGSLCLEDTQYSGFLPDTPV
jgi:hypothetical protein